MLTERGKQVRRSALKLMRENGLSHIGGSLSCTDILIDLFDNVMTKDDVFTMSKGHGSGSYYVLLREAGFSPKIEVHPHKDIKNGIPFTSGSLGHGIAFAVGIALAKRLKKEKGRVFVLIGDGELQEGSVYESFLIATSLRLGNLRVLVDNNNLQGSGKLFMGINAILEFTSRLGWRAFNMIGVGDAVDLTTPNAREGTFPVIIFEETVKASGIRSLEDTGGSHSIWMSDDDYIKAISDLK